MYKHLKKDDEVFILGYNISFATKISRIGRDYLYANLHSREYRFAKETGRSESGYYIRTAQQHKDSLLFKKLEDVLHTAGIRVLGADLARMRTVYTALKICLNLEEVDLT